MLQTRLTTHIFHLERMLAIFSAKLMEYISCIDIIEFDVLNESAKISSFVNESLKKRTDIYQSFFLNKFRPMCQIQTQG